MKRVILASVLSLAALGLCTPASQAGLFCHGCCRGCCCMPCCCCCCCPAYNAFDPSCCPCRHCCGCLGCLCHHNRRPGFTCCCMPMCCCPQPCCQPAPCCDSCGGGSCPPASCSTGCCDAGCLPPPGAVTPPNLPPPPPDMHGPPPQPLPPAPHALMPVPPAPSVSYYRPQAAAPVQPVGYQNQYAQYAGYGNPYAGYGYYGNPYAYASPTTGYPNTAGYPVMVPPAGSAPSYWYGGR